MKTTIIGRQMTVDEDLKEHITKKLKKFDKFFPDGAEANVTLYRIREKERLEVTISSGGTLFRGEEVGTTFLNALDSCIDSIERQIRKNKTRLARKLREGLILPEYQGSADDTDMPEEDEFRIRTKTFYFKPMTPEEAILQMNLLGHEFFVFNNADSGDTCVVYRRNDASYGLITPTSE